MGYEEFNNKIKTGLSYKLVHDVDLEGNTFTFPNDVTIEFQGGSISNGTLIGNGCRFINLDYKLLNNVTLQGTFSTRRVTTPPSDLTLIDSGQCYLYNDKPIWWTGTKWVDATGASV